jgi:hypothetical protein
VESWGFRRARGATAPGMGGRWFDRRSWVISTQRVLRIGFVQCPVVHRPCGEAIEKRRQFDDLSLRKG